MVPTSKPKASIAATSQALTWAAITIRCQPRSTLVAWISQLTRIRIANCGHRAIRPRNTSCTSTQSRHLRSLTSSTTCRAIGPLLKLTMAHLPTIMPKVQQKPRYTARPLWTLSRTTLQPTAQTSHRPSPSTAGSWASSKHPTTEACPLIRPTRNTTTSL